MRIHLGHHFYGAGNLGDDFMLAGFLGAMRSLAPGAAFTAAVPFPPDPLRRRFPEIAWQPYEPAAREAGIRDCDAWLGVGGSPFQSAQSRWFVDHLVEEAALCRRHGKPMYFLGVGVQTETELNVPEVRAVCTQAKAIWTRDAASARRLATLQADTPAHAAADLANVLFRAMPPAAAAAGRVTLVANFDYGSWPGATGVLAAVDRLPVRERVWLAQETRALPGAERTLHAALPAVEKAKWRLVVGDEHAIPRDEPSPPAGCGAAKRTPPTNTLPLSDALAQWPSGEWLITSRYHAALAGAWAGSKIVVIATNEKLRGVAEELGVPAIAPDANVDVVARALEQARPVPRPVAQAERAFKACEDFVGFLRAKT